MASKESDARLLNSLGANRVGIKPLLAFQLAEIDIGYALTVAEANGDIEQCHQKNRKGFKNVTWAHLTKQGCAKLGLSEDRSQPTHATLSRDVPGSFATLSRKESRRVRLESDEVEQLAGIKAANVAFLLE